MSTGPPNHQLSSMNNIPSDMMALAQPAKPIKPLKSAKSKPVAVKATKPAAPKQKTHMHRRSRTGCYTCRLRRKKCDEGTPTCTACKHLGLMCEYKRPEWWSNNDDRRRKKDDVKMIIKRKKVSEKTSHNVRRSIGSPPELSHSLSTSATCSEPAERTRSASCDSHAGYNFNTPPSSHHEFTPFTTPQAPSEHILGGAGAAFSPCDVDIKTERQMFINDIPTLKESTSSTFSNGATSAYPTPPPPGAILAPFPLGGEWTEQVYSERRESLTEETYCAPPPPPPPCYPDYACGIGGCGGGGGVVGPVALELDERDQQLLSHFIQHVVPTLFPVMESNRHGPAAADLILPALQCNTGYLHCCLSIAAQHYKASAGAQGGGDDEVDGDIMRHRYATISALCDALNRDEDHQQILEAALGLIFFQCCVGRFDDSLPDIAWHQHFQAAVSLAQKLELPRTVLNPADPLCGRTPFEMTLTAWIDILGATMRRRAPTFAHTYREKHLAAAHASLGLRELMGCDDRVMYLISEIACLDALKADGMDDITLCQHVHVLGDQIGLTELGEPPLVPAVDAATGALVPEQLARNMTAAFRLAARVYLCSLVPGFAPRQPSCVGLVERLAAAVALVPGAFDSSLAWVYLIGGAVSRPGSGFRALFAARAAALGELGEVGGFGRVACLLREVWARADAAADEAAFVHWRDVMQMKGWDFLLI